MTRLVSSIAGINRPCKSKSRVTKSQHSAGFTLCGRYRIAGNSRSKNASAQSCGKNNRSRWGPTIFRADCSFAIEAMIHSNFVGRTVDMRRSWIDTVREILIRSWKFYCPKNQGVRLTKYLVLWSKRKGRIFFTLSTSNHDLPFFFNPYADDVIGTKCKCSIYS